MTSLAEKLATTQAMKPRRERAAKARKAQAVALAPAAPSAALAVYRARAADYVAWVAGKLEDHSGRVSLGPALDNLRFTAVLRRAGRLAQNHARREMGRALKLKIPKVKDGDEAVLAAFVLENQRLFAKLLGDIVTMDALKGPEAALKLARWRSKLIASDQVYKLAAEASRYYAVLAGCTEFVWCTAGDERVRHGHQALSQTVQRYAAPPWDGREYVLPGQAPHCRCHASPVAPAVVAPR